MPICCQRRSWGQLRGQPCIPSDFLTEGPRDHSCRWIIQLETWIASIMTLVSNPDGAMTGSVKWRLFLGISSPIKFQDRRSSQLTVAK